jgi:hypothetical protein
MSVSFEVNGQLSMLVHTAMTLVDMSKIIFNLLFTILFIVDTGVMATGIVRQPSKQVAAL